MSPDNRHYIFNLETTKIELHFDKAEYAALSDEQKREIKSAFLWSSYGKCWVSRAKEPNLWRAKQVAEKLGFTAEQREGERLTYAEQLERQAERAEARAERYEGYAANAEGRAAQLQQPLDSMRGDISFFTQPNINSSAGRSFTNHRNRLYERYHKGFEEYRKSDYFKERAQTALDTASQAQFDSPGYLDRRIKECKKEIKKRESNAVYYEGILHAVENGEEKKWRGGEPVTVESVTAQIERELELIEKAMDKQGYLENRLEDIGGLRFNKDNIKVGNIVSLKYHDHVEIISTGPVNVGYKILTGGAAGMTGRAAYAEIKNFITAGEQKRDVHPFTVGERFTAVSRDYTNGLHDIKVTETVYEIIKASDVTIQLKPVDAPGKAITRKPVKTYSGKWRFSIDEGRDNTFYKQNQPPVSREESAEPERPSALDRLAAAKEAVAGKDAEKPAPDKTKDKARDTAL